MIDAAVRAYGDDSEKRESARRWLEETIPCQDDSSSQQIKSRFDELDRKPKRAVPWRKIFLIASMVIVACVQFPVNRIGQEDRQMFSWVMSMGPTGSTWTAGARTVFPSSSQLLLGDQTKTLLQQKKALWDSEPANPAFFSEYAAAYGSQHNSLPPDYFQTAARLDPDNAWFDYFGAGVVGRKAVKKLPQTKEEKAGKKVPRWKILDQEAHRKSLEIIRNATLKPRFESYEEGMMAKRISVLPQSTPPQWMASVAYLSETRAPYLHLLKLADQFAAAASELEQNRDTRGFLDLAADAKACTVKVSEGNVYNLVQELVVRALASSVCHNISERAASLGLEGETAWAAEWNEVFLAQRDSREKRLKSQSPSIRLVEQRASLMVASFYPVVMQQSPVPPSLEEGDLKPGRMQDYVWFSMISSAFVLVLLSMAATGFFLYRFRSSGVVRVMARRVERLLSKGDWTWIIGAGVLLPVGAAYSLMFFTSAGGWGYSVRRTMVAFGVMQPVVAFAAIALLLVIVPLLVARWRLRQRAGVFGFGGRDIGGWLSVVALLLFGTSFSYPWPYQISFGLGAMAAAWLLFLGIRATFSGSSLLLSRSVLSRVMLPVCAAGVLVMAGSFFGFHAARQFWFERDALTKLDPAQPGFSSYEYRLTKQMHGELLRLLEKHR